MSLNIDDLLNGGAPAASAEVRMCGICDEPILPGEARWKTAWQHHRCGKAFDACSKACRSEEVISIYQ